MKPRREGVYVTAKTFDGYRCSYRLWRSTNYGDKILRSHNLTIKAIFESHKADVELLYDGSEFMKEFKKVLDNTMMDTVIVAQNDPELAIFKAMEVKGLIKLITPPEVSAALFAVEWFNWAKIWLINSNAIELVDIRAVEVTENDTSNYLYTE